MPLPILNESEVTGIIAGVVEFVRSGRERFAASAEPLSSTQHAAMRPFFPADVLDQVRVVPPERADLPNPDFYYRARDRGFARMPDFSHLAEITLGDLILFHAEVTDRLLFHAMVHVVQYRWLGIERYVDLYLRNFVRSGVHILVPFEVHAYALDERFAKAPAEAFSVESEVRRWLEAGRYNP